MVGIQHTRFLLHLWSASFENNRHVRFVVGKEMPNIHRLMNVAAIRSIYPSLLIELLVRALCWHMPFAKGHFTEFSPEQSDEGGERGNNPNHSNYFQSNSFHLGIAVLIVSLHSRLLAFFTFAIFKRVRDLTPCMQF